MLKTLMIFVVLKQYVYIGLFVWYRRVKGRGACVFSPSFSRYYSHNIYTCSLMACNGIHWKQWVCMKVLQLYIFFRYMSL